MISPGLIYLVLSAALFAVAVVTHFHATALSVPLPEALTILTAILPILALVNAYIRPNLLLSARRQQHSSAIISYKHVPTALQTLQLLLTTILATILIQAVVPSRCVLEDRWMAMFRHRDSQAVRAIQDALECCGFNSVKDRAYPFGQPSTCAQTYGRSDSCRDKWRGVMQTSAGVDFGVVVAVALMQLLGLLLMKEGASWWTAWRIWGAAGRQWDGSTTTETQRRPLLTAPVEVVEDEEEQVTGTQDRSRTYGTTGDTGPRVEPSSVGGERNAWEE